MNQSLDKLFIHELTIPCILGTFPAEREEKQPVTVTICLFVDTKKAAQTDKLADAVDYFTLYQKIVAFVSNSQFYLLEKLADAVAKICLEERGVKQVTVHIAKPQALPLAKSSAIEITRSHEK